jgi:uncharacterized membrane protein
MDTTTPPTTPAPTTEDKTVAILSYLTLIGFIVAIVMHSSKKTRLGAFHLRQVLGLMLVLLFVLAFMKSILLFLIPLIYFAFGVSIFVLWLMGFIAAINGQMNPMPVVGPYYQKWFGTAFE